MHKGLRYGTPTVEVVSAFRDGNPSIGDFRLTTQQIGPDVWVVSLSGDCGDAAGSDLSRQLASLPLKESGQAVVDLSSAAAVDVGLFRHLVTGGRAARRKGIAMTIISEDSSLRDALGAAEREGALRLEAVLAVGIRHALKASLA